MNYSFFPQIESIRNTIDKIKQIFAANSFEIISNPCKNIIKKTKHINIFALFNFFKKWFITSSLFNKINNLKIYKTFQITLNLL